MSQPWWRPQQHKRSDAYAGCSGELEDVFGEHWRFPRADKNIHTAAPLAFPLSLLVLGNTWPAVAALCASCNAAQPSTADDRAEQTRASANAAVSADSYQ